MFSKASMYNIQCGVAYILIHCVFDSSIARKCMRADDEKQEINLVWPYAPLENGGESKVLYSEHILHV